MAQTIVGLEVGDLQEVLQGQPAYRARQIYEAVYRQRVSDLVQVTALPASLRKEIASKFPLGLPRVAAEYKSVDGTRRYLLGLEDGKTVETVLMPEEGRDTICISSQVGCPVNCQFCLTALLGVRRNLTAGEIIGQVCAVLRERNVSPPETRINLVFMGMGEPFLNYGPFMQAVRLLVGEMDIPESRMTVSTSGIVPAIREFAKEPVRPKLAVSLNASNNATRLEIMPITKKWDIEQLLTALKEVPLRTREAVTFEYVLLGGVNDQPEHAAELLDLLEKFGMRAKINLIVWNPGPGIAYTQPKPEDVAWFQQMLIAAGVRTYIRRPRGRDIYAACGQLKRTVERELVQL